MIEPWESCIVLKDFEHPLPCVFPGDSDNVPVSLNIPHLFFLIVLEDICWSWVAHGHPEFSLLVLNAPWISFNSQLLKGMSWDFQCTCIIICALCLHLVPPACPEIYLVVLIDHWWPLHTAGVSWQSRGNPLLVLSTAQFYSMHPLVLSQVLFLCLGPHGP